MISFLKNFLSGEKSPEEKAILSQQEAEKKHDVLVVEGLAMGEDEEDCDEDQENFSGPCCGGGCRG